MKGLQFILLFFIGANHFNTVKGGIQCHYCGRSGLCELPYDSDPEVANFITCEKSCMKFDGYGPDGNRVIVRDCGIYEADECTPDAKYMTTEATGTLCHCMLGECNAGTLVQPSLVLAWLAVLQLAHSRL